MRMWRGEAYVKVGRCEAMVWPKNLQCVATLTPRPKPGSRLRFQLRIAYFILCLPLQTLEIVCTVSR